MRFPMMTPPSTPALLAQNLTKRIGDRTIVDDVSFELHPGEVFGFLGPNGAGKTTTIRMLVGLIRPTAGSVRICGFDVRHDFERALRCIGCIVENPDLYRFMSGRENLEHFARMVGVGNDEIERVAAQVNLAHRLEQRVGTYSLGMRQRLGIAQALLGNPRVLILDEPANGLDPAGIREIRELLRHLAEDRKMAVFVSSHLLAEIELICDRVAIIHKGKIVTQGTVRDLIASSRTIEVHAASADRARELIEGMGHAVTASDDKLLVAAENDAIPSIVRLLTANDIDVLGIRPRMQTLEEMFLETTHGETVD